MQQLGVNVAGKPLPLTPPGKPMARTGKLMAP